MPSRQDYKREWERRKLEKAKKIGPEAVRALAFDKQLEVLNDPHRRKAIFCTRRAAKTFTAALGLVEACLAFPGCNVAFVGLSRLSAKNIIWKDCLEVINDKLTLGMDPNLSEQKFTFPNGSEILVTGIDADSNDMKKQLGRKLKRVILDEASMYSVDLRIFVDGIIGPALMDQGGDIWLAGTASDSAVGLFYDITQGIEPGYHVFRWSTLDNPHMKAQYLLEMEEIKRDRPLFMETNIFKQHYLNQWCVNEDAQCYRFDATRNVIPILPHLKASGWTRVLGVDLGHSPDPTAFVVCAYHENDRRLFIQEAYDRLQLDFTSVANEIKRLQLQYDINQVVIDGSAKQGVAEMVNRHGLSLVPADKRDKAEFIHLMSDDLVQGKIVLLPSCTHGDGSLAMEWTKLSWITKDGKVIYPLKENPNCSNHKSDAALYAWRLTYSFLSEPVPTYPKPQSAMEARNGWVSHTSKLMEEALEEQILREENDEAQLFADECMFNDLDPLQAALNRKRRA